MEAAPAVGSLHHCKCFEANPHPLSPIARLEDHIQSQPADPADLRRGTVVHGFRAAAGSADDSAPEVPCEDLRAAPLEVSQVPQALREDGEQQ